MELISSGFAPFSEWESFFRAFPSLEEAEWIPEAEAEWIPEAEAERIPKVEAERIPKLECILELKSRRAMLVELELAAWGWSGYQLPSSKARRARLTLRFDGARKGRTRLGKSLRYLWKACLSKQRNRLGNADHMQICSDYGAFSQTVCRCYAETEESMQISKNPCNSYNELSSKKSICEPRSPAPRSRGDSKCDSGQMKEDDVMTRFSPTLEQRLHDALEPILGPVACELQSQDKEARKERERLLALEKQKLALNLKELQRLKRRRAGRLQRSRRE